jgi:hypothetical protein
MHSSVNFLSGLEKWVNSRHIGDRKWYTIYHETRLDKHENVLCAILIAAAVGAAACEFSLPRAEFAKYHKAITGRDAPETLISFSLDSKVSNSGKDAYRIKTNEFGGVSIIGSNMRSVWYGLYDLLERRGGCHWFWDGDVVPKKNSIDLSGLDIHEEAHFEYRAIRYFAHRGLTRFQAEHWGPEDWKQEIDWILKRRLNVFMLRIGQDDLFQISFPDVCSYPDPAKALPGAGKGYNDRTLFWSLQFRGELRRNLQKYAFERGLMAPEDFGTMTHWYSRTPEDFLEKKKPQFLPQSNSVHRERNGLVWDIRTGNWADEYWKMTKVAVDSYGKGAPAPQLLHTIGLGERMCYRDRKKNFNLKIEALKKFLNKAHHDYPNAKVLLAGWDFYLTWKPNEVRDLLPFLDPARDIIWDYEADQIDKRSLFTDWGVVRKFPYTYSIFLAYEKALDARANYPLIEERQKIVQNDPFCKGYIFWPESSHTDTLLLRFFTANAWSARPLTHCEVLDEFCANRYGEHAALMKAAWKTALPSSWQRDWGNNYSKAALSIGSKAVGLSHLIRKWEQPVTQAEDAFARLLYVPWDNPFIQRDSIDIARMVLDRVIALRIWKFSHDYTAWSKGRREGQYLPARINQIASLCDKMADILALDTDYSLWESLERLNPVEKIQNPLFEKTLFENSSCNYCRSHQYELARHWYAPHVKAVAARIARVVASNDHKADRTLNAESERLELKAKPLNSLRPTLPRTEGNFQRIFREIIAILGD